MELFSLIFFAVAGFLLLVLNIFLWLRVKRFEKIITDPGDDKNTKILLQNISSELRKLDKDVQGLYEINSQLKKISRRGICKIGVTRFNAFSEKSGNQSFAVAMLDFRDNGIIFSNLQTIQGARLFIRSIRQGEANNGAELLVEEKKALERAKQIVF